MGGDCCGNGAPQNGASQPNFSAALSSLEDQQNMAAPAVAANGAAQNGKAAPQPKASHKDWVDKLKPYFDTRIQLFDKYAQRGAEEKQRAQEANVQISVMLPNGTEQSAVKGVTTPMEVAKQISSSLAKRVVVAKVDGKDWDLFRPLEADCQMELLDFEHKDGKHTFWHSSSHILGEALELCFGVKLTIGPALEEGFYYDCFLDDDRKLTDADRAGLEKKIAEIIKEKQSFQRVVVTRNEALEMFQENQFKLEIIGGLPESATITLYRCGPMVDLCTGPHLPNTGYLKAHSVQNMSAAFWRADAKREHLQRVYGITFPDKKSLEDYKHRMEEAKRRDHRNVGKQMELFYFNELSPGSCFFAPNGARIYNSLIELMRNKYWDFGYEEIVTPNIYNLDLWKTSGHAEHYKQNMFLIDIEKAEFGMKPMNCPGHCLLFATRTRSYRELPIRWADFGVLHRNEYSGALHGLTRVRRFQQDDAHIFCRPDQVASEVANCLKLVGDVYDIFGLDFEMRLSTRPEGFLGEVAVWDRAEDALRSALDSTGRAWEVNEGDGAFYGPKIDITVFDALRRKFQCATVQLDFQLPIRFKLQYQTEGTATERPVMVHRAVLGSVERMFAILTEHYAGKWPFWLSPRQVMVIPISEASQGYAMEVKARLHKARFFVECDLADKKMEKKIREAQLDQFNYILVVGEQEKKENKVNIRTRDNKRHGAHDLEDLIATLRKERETYSLESLFGHQSDTVAAAQGDAVPVPQAQEPAVNNQPDAPMLLNETT